MLNPKTNYTARLFVAFLFCSFVFISIVGFVSNYLYQGLLQQEIEKRLDFSHSKVEKEVSGIFGFLETSHRELLESQIVMDVVKDQTWQKLPNALKKYRFGSLNFYKKDGSFLNSYRRNVRAEFTSYGSSDVHNKKLDITVVERVLDENKFIAINSDKFNTSIYSYHEFKVGEQSYISSITLKVRNSFFEKMGVNLGVLFALRESGNQASLSFPVDVKEYLGSQNLETGDVESYRGIFYAYKRAELLNFPQFNLVSFVDVDSLVESVGGLHFRIFLVCLLSFILLAPFLYYLASFLSLPASNLKMRLEEFSTGENTKLIPVTSEDEFGSITRKMNELFSSINDSSQEMEARVLENVVMNQKVSNLKKDFSRLTNDYLLSRIYRRYLDNLISEANYSQSVSTNASKFLATVNELVDYLDQVDQHKGFVRKHNLSERLKDLLASTENLSVHSLRMSENLIDHLWLMDKKNLTDSPFSIHLTRVNRMISGIFPKMKINIDDSGTENLDCDLELFITLFSLCLFLCGKQSRDGNKINVSFQKVQNKKFQTYLAFVIESESPISYELSELDYEGQHLVKMIETTAGLIKWPMIFPSRNRSKVERLKFQIKIDY